MLFPEPMNLLVHYGDADALVEQCPKENGRAKAALDYLEHSRYRDYETALAYLSDSSAVCEKQIREVLKREIQKTTALTCH